MRGRCLRGVDGIVVSGQGQVSFGFVAGAGGERQQGKNTDDVVAQGDPPVL